MSALNVIPASFRRIALAAPFAAAATLGGSAFRDPAIACAAPRGGDIGAYDRCWQSGIGRGFNDQEWEDHLKWCCSQSGGDWDGTKCVAPPAEEQAGPAAPPGGVATQTPEPAPPLTRVPL